MVNIKTKYDASTFLFFSNNNYGTKSVTSMKYPTQHMTCDSHTNLIPELQFFYDSDSNSDSTRADSDSDSDFRVYKNQLFPIPILIPEARDSDFDSDSGVSEKPDSNSSIM